MEKLIVFIIPFLLFSGCISSAENIELNEEVPIKHHSYLHSYQFWNELPAGVGQSTTINYNGSIEIFLNVTIFTHEEYPTTLIISSAEETHYYENFTTGRYLIHHVIDTQLDNLTVETLSYGHHNMSETPIGDYFIVYIDVDEWA